MCQIQLKLKSFNALQINRAIETLQDIIHSLDIGARREISLPKKIKKITVLRSPHIDKKSREQFQIKRITKFIIFDIKNHNIALLFLEILKNLYLFGVEMQIKISFYDFFLE